MYEREKSARRWDNHLQKVDSIGLKNPLLDGFELSLLVDYNPLLVVLSGVMHVHLYIGKGEGHFNITIIVTKLEHYGMHVTFVICSMPCSVMSERRLASRQRKKFSSSILSSCSSSYKDREGHGERERERERETLTSA